MFRLGFRRTRPRRHSGDLMGITDQRASSVVHSKMTSDANAGSKKPRRLSTRRAFGSSVGRLLAPAAVIAELHTILHAQIGDKKIYARRRGAGTKRCWRSRRCRITFSEY